MVKLAIQIKLQADNIKEISKPTEDFRWHVKLKNGGEETDKFVYISQTEEVEVKGSRSSANHVQNIGGKSCSVSILTDKINGYVCPRNDNDDDASDDGQSAPEAFQTIVAFECRGCEISDFMFSDGWSVIGRDGTSFEDVDLNDEWYDVDDSGEPVSLTEMEFRIVRLK